MTFGAEVVFPKRPLLSALAAWALFVVAFSYLFTIALAICCVLLPFELLQSASKGNLELQALLLLGTGLLISAVILRALIPRRNEFQVLGAQLDLSVQPQLRLLLQQVTGRLGEPLPDTVYLSADANAGVADRDSSADSGKRRVLILGLPLLATMTVEEFRALVAHECAHFYTGDTRLTPWVYSARSAMLRVMTSMDSDSGLMNVVQWLGFARLLYVAVKAAFDNYWNLFLRCTYYVSRAQEFRSDELSAYLVGPSHLISGLKLSNRAGALTQAFWRDVITPAISSGFLPPLAESFQELASAPGVKAATDAALLKMLQQSNTDPFSAHPPLKLRLDKLEKLQATTTAQTVSKPALELLDQLPLLELKLIEALYKGLDVSALKRANWEDAGPAIYIPLWRASVHSHRAFFSVYTIERITEALARVHELTNVIRDPVGILLTRDQRSQRARDLIWKAFALGAIETGWTLQIRPGSVSLLNGDQKIVPGQLIELLWTGKIKPADWSLFCDKHKMSNQPLITP